MTRSQIVTAHRMVGSVIPDTLLASLIIIQMSRVGYAPSMSIVTYSRDQSQTLCATLLISFAKPVKPNQRHALVTLFSMGTSTPEYSTGKQGSTQGLTNTTTTRISALRKRLTYWVSFIRYLCQAENNEEHKAPCIPSRWSIPSSLGII